MKERSLPIFSSLQTPDEISHDPSQPDSVLPNPTLLCLTPLPISRLPLSLSSTSVSPHPSALSLPSYPSSSVPLLETHILSHHPHHHIQNLCRHSLLIDANQFSRLRVNFESSEESCSSGGKLSWTLSGESFS